MKKNSGFGLIGIIVSIVTAVTVGIAVSNYLNSDSDSKSSSECKKDSDCPSGYACSSGYCVKPCTGCTTASCGECSSMGNGYRCICKNRVTGGYLNCTAEANVRECCTDKCVEWRNGKCLNIPNCAEPCPPPGDICGTLYESPCACGCRAGLGPCPTPSGSKVCLPSCACRWDGSSCTKNSDCCYNNCVNGKCGGSSGSGGGSNPPPGSGGGGGGGGSTCFCTSWVNKGCGSNGCPSNKMNQTRTCTPSNCDSQSRCVDNSACNNNNPQIINPNVTTPNGCSFAQPIVFLSWNFFDPDGDSQAYYQVQISTDSNFSSIKINSGKVKSSSNSYATSLNTLSYNTTYYWKVTVWDNRDGSSSAIGSSFTTPKHRYPTPDFTWTPSQPAVGEKVQLKNASTVYDSAQKSLSWTFEGGDISNSSAENPTVTFNSSGQKKVTLTITDSDSYSCTTSKFIPVQSSFPSWREITPK